MSVEFTYRPLNQDRPEIRLLELKPAAERALPLEGILRHCSLSSATFCCLSYVWGDPNRDKKSEIVITSKKTIGEHFKPKNFKPKNFKPRKKQDSDSNKCHMTIGSSLAAALKNLRHEQNRVTIWADAVCINQGDAEEKNWQIPLMMRIFSNATSVHSWLGPRYDENPEVVSSVTAAFDLVPVVTDLLGEFDCMQRLADETSWVRACFALAEPRTRDGQGKNQVQLFWTAASQKLRDGLASKGLWDRYLSAFKTLSQVEYFQRMWVRELEARIR
jgi:hypothetical protein